jgi:hypothetical protein
LKCGTPERNAGSGIRLAAGLAEIFYKIKECRCYSGTEKIFAGILLYCLLLECSVKTYSKPAKKATVKIPGYLQ